MDLLDIRAKLQQERHVRGALLRQDALPVRLLDHHLGVHPAGGLPGGQLLRPRLLLPVRTSGRRRRRLETNERTSRAGRM